jgi:hypothetical protein
LLFEIGGCSLLHKTRVKGIKEGQDSEVVYDVKGEEFWAMEGPYTALRRSPMCLAR